ncbi:hypothetical protein [Streptomyces sp. 7N604]|uniref:hypothetical protein n=1 Tax=Streptomyces sp. 7N604 TaxID=3457415 RepID=UPI003FD435CA
MPAFTFEPDPDNPTRLWVYLDTPDNPRPQPQAEREFLGTVWESTGAGWTADFPGPDTNSVPGFTSDQLAAEFLYWFAPAVQSARSRPAGRANPHTATDNAAALELSLCACCVTNGCPCEGTRRASTRTKVELNATLCPSLIPDPGVLYSLLKTTDGYLVDLDTRGAGSGVGYLQQRDDGTYSVREGHQEIGRAATPEAGMWAMIRHHTGSKRYARLLRGFEPTEDTPSSADTERIIHVNPDGDGLENDGADHHDESDESYQLLPTNAETWSDLT